MKFADASTALLGTISGVILGCLFVAILLCPNAPQPTTPLCYTFHRGVVIVPAVCKQHDICETAIEAKVCDSILIPKAKK